MNLSFVLTATRSASDRHRAGCGNMAAPPCLRRTSRRSDPARSPARQLVRLPIPH